MKGSGEQEGGGRDSAASGKKTKTGQGGRSKWTRPRVKFALLSPMGFALALLVTTVALGGGVVMRVSTDSVGVQAYAYSNSDGPAISADGKYVAFNSSAANLVPGDTNMNSDIFVKDTLTGAATRVSTNSAGNQGNGWSSDPAISADGRYVAFTSYASNLVAGDTNGAGDVFVKDTLTGATSRVSTDASGDEGNGWSSGPAISNDGMYVAFGSGAANLVAGDSNGAGDVFVKDTLTGATTRVSTDAGGNQGNDGSYETSISADGRYVAFSSYASNLVPGDTNGGGAYGQDVFIKDTQTGVTTRVSTSSGGAEALFSAYSGDPSISADGSYVAFFSYASNLVAGDTNGVGDIFVKDTLTGATSRVSTDGSGNEGNNYSGYPSISADGRYVTFSSYASNLVAGDTNGAADVFLAETSIACDAGQPDLGLQKTNVYWASFADYTAGLLSIDFSVNNNGANAAYIVQVTGSTATNSATCATCTASLANLVGGASHTITLKYNIPTGVTAFLATVNASAQDGCGTGYTYP